MGRRREVVERSFDRDRLAAVLDRIAHEGLEVVRTQQPSPLAFPLLLERVEARVSTESDQRRVERIKEQWLEGAGA